MNNTNNKEKKIFACKRTRIAAYLIKQGFELDSIEPEGVDSKFNVYKFKASPELYAAVLAYTSGEVSKEDIQK